MAALLGITLFTRSSRMGDEFAATLLSEEEFVCAMPVGHEFAVRALVSIAPGARLAPCLGVDARALSSTESTSKVALR